MPTSQWKPGQTIQYTRTRFVPVCPVPRRGGRRRRPLPRQERLPLQPSGPRQPSPRTAAYRVGTLQLLPASENIFLMLRSGWHPSEFAPDKPTLDVAVDAEAGRVHVQEPEEGRDALSRVRRPRRPLPGQAAGGHRVGRRPAVDVVRRRLGRQDDSRGSRQLRPSWAANDLAEMRIDVDQTFVPAKLAGGGRDARELGIRVYHAFVEAR